MMITGGSMNQINNNQVDEKTFMTSCNQQEDEDSRSWKPTKYYKYKEDELLDEIDFHERDMNDMLKSLSEMEDLMKG